MAIINPAELNEDIQYDTETGEFIIGGYVFEEYYARFTVQDLADCLSFAQAMKFKKDSEYRKQHAN